MELEAGLLGDLQSLGLSWGLAKSGTVEISEDAFFDLTLVFAYVGNFGSKRFFSNFFMPSTSLASKAVACFSVTGKRKQNKRITS